MDLTFSGLNSLSLIFIVASCSVFDIYILVLIVLLDLILLMHSLYNAVKKVIFLSLLSSFNEILEEFSLIWSGKVCRCFYNFASNFPSWSEMFSFIYTLNLL